MTCNTLFHSDVEKKDEKKGLLFFTQVITEKSAETRVDLLMQGARVTDSGVYACKPSNAPEVAVKVHVISGEKIGSIIFLEDFSRRLNFTLKELMKGVEMSTTV